MGADAVVRGDVVLSKEVSMFRLLAFVFWFSLLFGTYVASNGIGNWIALLAVVLMLRSRRRNAQQPAAATPASARNHIRYREGQEDQLGALGLVVNGIILWNSR